MGLLIPGDASLTFSPGGAALSAGCSNRLPLRWGLAFERRACWPGPRCGVPHRGECRKVVMHNRVTITLGNELICRGEHY